MTASSNSNSAANAKTVVSEEVKRSRRWMIVNVALAVCTILVYLIGLAPAYGRYRQLHRTVTKQHRELGKLQEQLNMRHALRVQYEELLKRVGRPLENFERGRLIARLVRKVSELCNASGIRIRSLQPMEIVANRDQGWLALPVELIAIGSLKGIKEFLARMSKVIPPLSVERMTLRASAGKPDELYIQMRIAQYMLLSDDAWKQYEGAQGRMRRRSRR